MFKINRKALEIQHGTTENLKCYSSCGASFYFLITYEVCKKRKYYNRMSKKKNSLLLKIVHVLYVLEDKTSKKNAVYLSVCTWTFAVDTITFEGISGSKQNLVGVFYV